MTKSEAIIIVNLTGTLQVLGAAHKLGQLWSRLRNASKSSCRGICHEAEFLFLAVEKPLSAIEENSSDEGSLRAYGKDRLIDAQF